MSDAEQSSRPTPAPRPPTGAAGGAPAIFSLGEAASRFPNRPHPATVVRWALGGVVAAGGRRVKLGTVKIGGRRYTDDRSIRAFIAEVSGGRAAAQLADEARSAAADQAGRELDAEGIR